MSVRQDYETGRIRWSLNLTVDGTGLARGASLLGVRWVKGQPRLEHLEHIYVDGWDGITRTQDAVECLEALARALQAGD